MDPAHRFEEYLDRRRSIGERLEWRPCESLDALADRRISQTPRLSREWLTYFAYFGARKTAEGWRWKSDPLASWGFGPDRPDWIGPFWKHVTVPVLAVVGSVTDTWGPLPEPLLSQRLEHIPDCTRAVIDDAGHFMAIEEPKAVAELLLSFLDR
jgi:pimeloyl-ACP methyl ester carboxylesterase